MKRIILTTILLFFPMLAAAQDPVFCKTKMLKCGLSLGNRPLCMKNGRIHLTMKCRVFQVRSVGGGSWVPTLKDRANILNEDGAGIILNKETARVEAIVYFEGVRLADTTVRFYSYEVNEKKAEAVTDANGKFQMQIEPGEYVVTFEKLDENEHNLLPTESSHVKTTGFWADFRKGKNVHDFELSSTSDGMWNEAATGSMKSP